MQSFRLERLPEGVEAVEALFTRPETDDEGYVLCRLRGDQAHEWVTWQWYRKEEDGVLTVVYVSGHYFTEREDALSDLLERARV